jgi:TRAP-type C4-dicarboxylate transport system permease small subunit
MARKKPRKSPAPVQRTTPLESVPSEDAAAAEREARRALPGFFRVLDDVLRTVMVFLLVALIVTVSVNVIGRFAFNRSLATSDELSRFLFIWVIFLGAALAHLHREHIAVDFVVRKLPPSMSGPMALVQELLIGVVLVALLASAWRVMQLSLGTSPLLGVPLSWVNASVPLCAAVMLLITVYRIVAVFRPAPRGTEG